MALPRREDRIDTSIDIFVNRDDQIALFNQQARSIPADGAVLQVFYGMGGQGKTALCNRLIKEAKAPANDHLKISHVDLADRNVDIGDGIKWLVKLRNGFAENGINLPVFDIALALVWEATRDEDPYPKLSNAWLAKTSDALGDVASDSIQASRELIEKTVETIPGLGFIVKKLSSYALDKSKTAWLKNACAHMGKLFDIDGKFVSGSKLTGLLPWFLAQDLNRHLENNNQHRFVLFIDEYETLTKSLTAGRTAEDGNFDKMLQEFVSETKGLMVVVFGRDPLPWREIDVWANDLDGNQHQTGGLEDNYARSWMNQIGLKDEAICDAIIDGARETSDPNAMVFPLFLKLQVEHWADLVAFAKTDDREFGPEEFSSKAISFNERRRDLVDRLFRNYGERLSKTLKQLSVASLFDQAAFEHLFPDNDPAIWHEVRHFSLLNENEDGFFTYHKAVGEALESGLNDEARQKSMESLLKHFESRCASENLKVTPQSISALQEASFLRRKLGIDGYVSWLAKWDGPVQQAAHYTTSQTNWQTALSFCINKLGNEHPDTAASYNNVATNLNAQGRYKEAEPLYKKALQICKTALGDQHPDTAASYNNVAYNLNAQGRYEEAEPLFKKALEIWKTALGDEHPSTAAGYSNVADNLNAQGRYEEAEPLFKKAVSAFEAALGVDHPNSKIIRKNYETFLAQHGG